MNKISKFLSSIVVIGAVFSITSCNDFLEVEPTSSIIPENYLNEETQLGTYAISLYADLFDSHDSWSYGTFQGDAGTDNMCEREYANHWGNKTVIGEWKTTTDDTSNWEFEDMYAANYFFDQVLPLYEAGEISGTEENIDHYIGEMYVIRAYGYYKKLKLLGDFPIITTTLDTDWDVLTDASQRYPRNEVARFILEDLDKAIDLLMETAPDGRKNRISKYVAQLLKSRVALFEASWLTNFKGTAFVPGGTDWPGADMSYNSGFSYVAGSIDAEIQFFLTEAMEASAAVADAVALTSNTKIIPQPDNETNPYFQMFSEVDLSGYSEILMWREYNLGLGVTHNVNVESTKGNYGAGVTHDYVMSFLDINGLPYYANGALFTEDQDGDIYKIHGEDGEGGYCRDNRIYLFLKVPYQYNLWYNSGTHGVTQESNAPLIYETLTNGKYTTGYCSRKGVNPDASLTDNGGGYGGCPTFRASEALLNYIEASYMYSGTLDSKATSYWNELRERAGIVGSIQTTIDAIDIATEARYDWGAYSAGSLLTDKTMMAIRKERRSEFFTENFRADDLYRWRSLDQLITTPQDVRGMKYWNCENYDLFTDEQRDLIIAEEGNTSSNMSVESFGDYLLVYKLNTLALAYDGLTWQMAHYLSPIGIRHMTLTGDDTPIYQNPYWSTTAGLAALQ